MVYIDHMWRQPMPLLAYVQEAQTALGLTQTDECEVDGYQLCLETICECL